MKENDKKDIIRSFLEQWKRKPEITAAITAVICLLVTCYQNSDPLFAEEKRTRLQSINLPFVTPSLKHELYWDLSCPWEQTKFSVANRNGPWLQDPNYAEKPWADTFDSYQDRANEARKFSEEAGALETVLEEAPKAFRDGRKVIIMGDSLSRQLFISLSCLMFPSYIKAHATAWIGDQEHTTEFNDARIQLKKGMGELLFAPRAGNVIEYDWRHPAAPMETDSDWLQACKDRRPFEMISFFLDMEKITNDEDVVDRITFKDGERRFDKFELTNNDVVVMNSGLHTKRSANHERISQLLDCMESATQEERDNLWPKILYSRSSIQHFDNPTGGWNGKPTKRCGNKNYNVQNQIEDEEVVKNRVDIVGVQLNYTELGHLHVWGERTDCTHWFQPGLPDLVASDVVKHVAKMFP